MPLRLFEMAEEADLVFELDRKCRRRALAAAAGLPAGQALRERVPLAMYDPSSGARRSCASPGPTASPGPGRARDHREIGHRELHLFAEALGELTRCGFSIASTTWGGLLGLEKIAHLNPRYLKFDASSSRASTRATSGAR